MPKSPSLEAPPRRPWWPVLVLACLLAAAGMSCSLGEALLGEQAVSPTAVMTKTLRPTFTPPGDFTATPSPAPGQRVVGDLPPGVTAQAAPGQGAPAENANVVLFATPTSGPEAVEEPTSTRPPTMTPTQPPTLTPLPTPYVLVSAGSVTGRRGPGTAYEVVGEARNGQELMVMGRTTTSDWWLVCCISNQPAWVTARSVTAGNDTGQMAPVLTPGPTPTPAPTASPAPTPTITMTPEPPFDIAQGPLFPIERDNGVITMWIKVYEGPLDNQKPLPGYILKVFRDDVDVSQPALSHGNKNFDHTSWSDPTNDLEYNLKFEMNNAGEAKWRIYLARPDGSRVSPITEFTTLGDAYRNLVVYVAYWLAR